MKTKARCKACGLIAAVNTFNMCRRCWSKKTGSYWPPSEEQSFEQRMRGKYKENRSK